MGSTELMIEAEGLTKRYGETQALAGVSFSVPAGTILGLLGPNGAGKTTAVRILTTLALPDAGWGTVAGLDVVKHPGEVRRHIGVAAQDATLDPLLTGRQNLVLIGELSDMGRARVPVPGGGAAGAVRADRRRRPGRQGLLGRHAPPAGSGRLVDDPATRLVPGRADDRARPDEPPAGVGGHPGAAAGGRHRAADDAVSRGGRRAGQPHRRGGPRSGHRRGDAVGAQGGQPERPSRGDVGGASRRRRSAPSRRWCPDRST